MRSERSQGGWSHTHWIYEEDAVIGGFWLPESVVRRKLYTRWWRSQGSGQNLWPHVPGTERAGGGCGRPDPCLPLNWKTKGGILVRTEGTPWSRNSCPCFALVSLQGWDRWVWGGEYSLRSGACRGECGKYRNCGLRVLDTRTCRSFAGCGICMSWFWCLHIRDEKQRHVVTLSVYSAQ